MSKGETIDLDLILEAVGKLTGLGFTDMFFRYADAKTKAGEHKEKALILFLADIHNLIKEE